MSKSQKVYDHIEALNIWLGEIKESLAHKDYAVENPEDLLEKAKKFKVGRRKRNILGNEFLKRLKSCLSITQFA